MNFSTAIVLFIVIGIVACSLRTMIRDKKEGKSSCGGHCEGCGNSLCHHSQSLFEDYKHKKGSKI
jgi:hypothetical protein